MKLKSKYFEQLRDALLDAFNPASLQSMVRIKLELNLDEVVTQKGNYREQVENLIRWAEEQDCVEDLIAGARKENPTNKKLETAEEKLMGSGKNAYILSDEIAPTAEDTAVDTYTDEKTGLEMICIPAGEYIYGEGNRLEYLPEFWIAKTPVTNELYFEFVRDTGHDPPEQWEGKSPTAEIADHPVAWISWDDAMAYADWVGMDLPTEQEWEKAARGTDGFIYPWGNEWIGGCCNTSSTGIGTTTPVGQYSPQGDSPYGCMDMAGNVWEWTESWYDDKKMFRVLRGGVWSRDPGWARATCRYIIGFPNHSDDGNGFRVVRRLPPE